MRVSVKGTARQVMHDIGVDVPGIAKASQVTAMNKTSAKVLTQFRRQLAQRTGIKQKDLKPLIKQFKASRKEPKARIWMGLRARLRLIKVAKNPTAKFDQLAQATLHGKSGAASFKAKVDAGKNGGFTHGFFVRKPGSVTTSGRDTKGRLKRGRLPIEQVTLSLQQVGHDALLAAVKAVPDDEYERQLIYDMKRRLKRHQARQASRSNSRRR